MPDKKIVFKMGKNIHSSTIYNRKKPGNNPNVPNQCTSMKHLFIFLKMFSDEQKFFENIAFNNSVLDPF